MHRVPAGRANWRMIDGERVCAAIDAVQVPGGVGPWAALFDALSDPGRLSLLLAIHSAGPICVSDLAVATGMRDTTVSQALRLLRDRDLVAPERDGKIVRYALTSPALHDLLHVVGAGRPQSAPHPS